MEPAGFSVSLSSDSKFLAVGGPADDNGAGATWVFTHQDNCDGSDPCYIPFGPKLVGNNAKGKANQGTAVDIKVLHFFDNETGFFAWSYPRLSRRCFMV